MRDDTIHLQLVDRKMRMKTQVSLPSAHSFPCYTHTLPLFSTFESNFLSLSAIDVLDQVILSCMWLTTALWDIQ